LISQAFPFGDTIFNLNESVSDNPLVAKSHEYEPRLSNPDLISVQLSVRTQLAAL
jgi:hypothetical protein